MRALVFGCVISLAACGAFAQLVVIEDFEAGNTFSGGTVMADPEDAGNSVLYLAGGVGATLALPGGASSAVTVSMRVYDGGQAMHDIPEGASTGTGYGFNVGVIGTYSWGVTLLQKTWLNGNQGYGYTGVNQATWPSTPADIWSAGWYGGPRQVTSLATVGTGTPAAPEIPGVGAWSTWSFTLAPDGSMTFANDGITNPRVTEPALETAIDTIYLVGGKSASEVLAGVYIDDVSVGTITTLQADFDADGDVDLDDFVILKTNFGTGTTHDQGDADYDNDVDLDDFVILKNEFGS